MNIRIFLASIFVFALCCAAVFYPFPAQSGDAIHKAAYKGKIERVQILLKNGVDFDERDSFGGTALHAAMFQDDIEVIRLLIEAGYDVDAQGTSNGFTPLHDAVWANNYEGAKLLLESGARLGIRSNRGFTPYEKAVNEGRTRIASLLKKEQ
ncbi:ankyrin repeat domain-containing protein [Maridesulfovibrio sp.]|uniref:ankyrin repeat domain-containing protein n=1 Tax=Maridesulfovibrio sp. TaxID=2795000 RepID=UPI003BABA26B